MGEDIKQMCTQNNVVSSSNWIFQDIQAGGVKSVCLGMCGEGLTGPFDHLRYICHSDMGILMARDDGLGQVPIPAAEVKDLQGTGKDFVTRNRVTVDAAVGPHEVRKNRPTNRIGGNRFVEILMMLVIQSGQTFRLSVADALFQSNQCG